MHSQREKAQMINHAAGVWFRTGLVISGLLAGFTRPAGANDTAAGMPAPDRPIAVSRPVLPLVFEPNMGQTDSSVRFVARGGDYTVFLTGEGAVLALRGAEPVRVRPACAQTLAAVEGL